MTATNTSLINLQNTGFSLCVNPIEQGTGAEYHKRICPTIARVLVIGACFLGIEAYLLNQYPLLGQKEITITEALLQQKLASNLSFYRVAEIQNTYEQIKQLKISMGFNILELAAILNVSRPTIYDWIESKKTTIHKKNQKRLNLIYEISKTWESKNIGQLGGYLHKPLGATNVSLFDLLKSDNLNLSAIDSYLDSIAQTKLKKRQTDEAHEALLKKHGFEPISKEDMEERLNDINFWG